MKEKDHEYIYKAINRLGEEISGEVVGVSVEEAARWLNSENLMVLDIQRKYWWNELFRKEPLMRIGKVKLVELSQFAKDLGIILESGISILEALKILKNRSSDARLRRDINGVREFVRNGETLSEAMQCYPGSFPELFVFLVRSGEASGELAQMLEVAGGYYERLNENRHKMKEILFYPILLIIVSVAVEFFLLTVVLPQFIELFASMDQTLPWVTRTMIQISVFLKENIFNFIFFIAVMMLFGLAMQSNREIKLKVDQLKIRIPVYGKLMCWEFMMVFSKITAIFLNSGVDILTVLEGMKTVTNNLAFEITIVKLKEDIKNGCSITEAVESRDIFEEAFVQFIAVGESSGTIGEMMEVIATFYESQYKHRVQMLRIMIEPVLLLLIGGGVMMMVLAIMLPIFDLYLIYSNM